MELLKKDRHHPWRQRPCCDSRICLLKISCEEMYVSKTEENNCERQNVAYLASSDLAKLECVEDQPSLVVGTQRCGGCVMRSRACLCE